MPQPALNPAPGDPAVDAVFDEIDTNTGEVAAETALVPARQPAWQQDDTYVGIAALILSDAQIAILTDPVTDAEIEIKPDSFGAVYLCHASYRKRLNAAFRPGGWAQRQISPWRYDPETHILSAEFALYARGEDGKVCYISKAIGAQKYHGGQGDSDMTYDDAAQGAESNALTRNCKQLGIAIELWEKRTATEIRNRLGVCVFYEKYGSDRKKIAWRRYDDAPIKGETGLVPDSPNRDKYRGQPQAQPTSQASRPSQPPPQQPRPAPPPAQPSASPAVPATKPEWGKNGIITEPQAKRLFALTKKHGISEQAMGEYLRTRWNVTSSKQITKQMYQSICDWVQRGGD